LTFPNRQATPSLFSEKACVSPIAISISIEFRVPERHVASGHYGIAATGVLMPETAMNENYGAVSWKDKIWLAWQLFYVQAISKTLGV
jgi:hypothetical protein